MLVLLLLVSNVVTTVWPAASVEVVNNPAALYVSDLSTCPFASVAVQTFPEYENVVVFEQPSDWLAMLSSALYVAVLERPPGLVWVVMSLAELLPGDCPARSGSFTCCKVPVAPL